MVFGGLWWFVVVYGGFGMLVRILVVFSSFGELGGVCGSLWWFVVVCSGL